MSKKTPGTYSKKLKDFLDASTVKKAGIIFQKPGNEKNPLVTGLEYDSRHVKKGNLFFALPGLHTNGIKFIDSAVKNGACVIVHGEDYEPQAAKTEITYIKVKDPRYAMSAMASSFYGYPSRHMTIIGVTGTEGKSTTVCLVYQLLKLSGCKAGFISTVMLGNGKKEIWNPEHQTTPEAVTIHRLLAEMKDNGVKYAVIESSSHGLSKRTNRLGDVAFDVAVLTTMNHDHMEFHGTWEQYRSDKAELFRALDLKKYDKNEKTPRFAVANNDDPSVYYFTNVTKHKTYTYSSRGGKADLSIQMVSNGSSGNWYDVKADPWGSSFLIRDKLPGAFNPGNVLAAMLVVSGLLSKQPKDLVKYILSLKPIRGRMTAIDQGQPFEVIVDYAHTPSSFNAVFPPLRNRIAGSEGRIISLFGSAGERDTNKRSEQGEIAAKYSDIVFLCDEDPRSEDPFAILEEIASGIRDKKLEETLFLIPQRPAAIRRAFSLAQRGDLVILLGKGHENSIIYADKTIPYDEINEAKNALAEMGFKENYNLDF